MSRPKQQRIKPNMGPLHRLHIHETGPALRDGERVKLTGFLRNVKAKSELHGQEHCQNLTAFLCLSVVISGHSSFIMGCCQGPEHPISSRGA